MDRAEKLELLRLRDEVAILRDRIAEKEEEAKYWLGWYLRTVGASPLGRQLAESTLLMMEKGKAQ